MAEQCEAEHCWIYCNECAHYLPYETNAGVMFNAHLPREQKGRFERFFRRITPGGTFAPQYVYALPGHAGEFYHKRRERYMTALDQCGALSDLAPIIAEYV
jgi:hypothetical protein